jgi:poly(hydroxyalkanoate) depolymerase family esterase
MLHCGIAAASVGAPGPVFWRPRRESLRITGLRNLGDTVGRLAARRAAMAAAGTTRSRRSVLSEMTGFGSNPGDLRAWHFVPAGLERGAPLVVVLHGCTQTAGDYDHGTGWSALAEAEGFALLFAEQTRSNNPNLCFNWFVPADIRRGGGEVESIRQMVEAMVRTLDLDRDRIFVTGLSAGGAMAASMLATAPDLFAGGAIIAGMPHGVAGTMSEAFDRMRGAGLPDPAKVAALVRNASSHTGPWPTLSIWHGSADNTVDVANAETLAAGWASLHGLSAPSGAERINGHMRRVWRDPQGKAVIEAVIINGMGHGAPITVRGAEACGMPGSFMLETGVSSTRRIAAFWGIAPAVVNSGVVAPIAAPSGIEAIIGNALRQAGLLR